ncbi:MAG: PKD domain-containing protein, partial [Bacteroidota bacterium]
WNFGDGTTSSLANPTHTYAQGGTYQVLLTVVNSAGLTCTSIQTIVVGNTLACSANFAIYPDSTQLHTYIGVNLAYGNGPLTYTWNWGDGTSSTGAYPSHTYAGPGTYTICLFISDSQGCTDSVCYSFALLRLQGGAPITINVVPGNTGIGEPIQSLPMTVFPIPAKDQVQIRFNSPAQDRLQIRLMDVAGRVLKQELKEVEAGDINMSLELQNIPSGIYVLDVAGSQMQSQQKLIVE